jgi:hypothetical protein
MMKKIAGLGGLVLATVLLIFNSRVQAQEVTIAKVQGEVMVTRGDQTWPAKEGMAYQENDILKTGENCMVDFTMNGLAGCRMLASSECAVVSANSNAMAVKVNDGNVILNLKKLPAESSFELETPTAVASVRGTQFWGRVNPAQIENPVTTFAVREGSVEVLAKTAGQSFMLTPGQALDIPLDASSVPSVRPALDAEMAAMEQAESIPTEV